MTLDFKGALELLKIDNSKAYHNTTEHGLTLIDFMDSYEDEVKQALIIAARVQELSFLDVPDYYHDKEIGAVIEGGRRWIKLQEELSK